MIETNKREIGRQFIHLSGLWIVYFAYFFGNVMTGVGALMISLGFFFLSFYVRMKHDIRKRLPVRMRKLEELEDSFHNLINSVERESTKTNYMGAILFFMGIGVSLLFFPFKIAILSIIVLSVGDSFSTLIGVHWGRHKTKVNPDKSWEGTLGGLATSFLVCLFFANPLIALVAASVGMFMEVMPFKINDNLLMPFSVGIVLWGISLLGFVI